MKLSPCPVLLVLLLAPLGALHSAEEPIAIGSRRELFVDRLLVGELKNTTLRLHEPVLAEPLKEPRPHRLTRIHTPRMNSVQRSFLCVSAQQKRLPPLPHRTLLGRASEPGSEGCMTTNGSA